MLHLVLQIKNGSELQRIAAGNEVLFLGHAVYGLLAGGRWSSLLATLAEECPLWVLADDLKVRGIDQGRLCPGLELTDYPGFVQLVVRHEVIATWN